MKTGAHEAKPTGKKGAQTLRIVLTVLAALTLSYSLYRLAALFVSYREPEKVYQTLADSAVTVRPADNTDEAVPTPGNASGKDMPLPGAAASSVRRTVTLPERKNDEAPEQQEYLIEIDFDTLLAVNAQTVGWLYGPGTEISYPVMQSADNLDFLRTLPNGSHSESGSLFIDYRLDGITGLNTVIYGHYRKYGGMFSSLLNYREQSYFNEHRSLYLFTPESAWELQVIAVLSVDAYDTRCYNMEMTREELAEYLDYAAEHSVVDTGFDPAEAPVDRVVGLSTCSYEFQNSRMVVLCSLIQAD